MKFNSDRKNNNGILSAKHQKNNSTIYFKIDKNK